MLGKTNLTGACSFQTKRKERDKKRKTKENHFHILYLLIFIASFLEILG